MSRQGIWKDDRGFTLVEVLLVIVLMGIVLAIASSSWFDAVESRKVDSATNQIAADLRQAHSRATNRLKSWDVDFDGDSSYTLGPTEAGCPDDPDAEGCIEEDLDDDPAVHSIVVSPDETITFNSDGSASLPGGTTYTVSSADGDTDHDIVINEATSEVEIAP